MWTVCNAAVVSGNNFDEMLEGYIGQFLELVDEHPDVVAFLSDSARVLWPKEGPAVRRHTMIGLARWIFSQRAGAPRSAVNRDASAGRVRSLATRPTLRMEGRVRG
jgi:hypothetical protein